MSLSKKEKIFKQYIKNHHLPEIEKCLKVLKQNKGEIIIPYAQFLFSVIDYFSLLYVSSLEDNNFKKTDKQNFYNFIKSKYFPEKDRNKGPILYFIRNGIMHQIFPKKCALVPIDSDMLIYKSNDPTLNVSYLEKITRQAINSFINDVENDPEVID